LGKDNSKLRTKNSEFILPMKQILFIILAFTSTTLVAQNSISLETQVYPAGIIPGIRFDLNLSDNSFLTSGIGYNFTDRQDFGKNDNEEGGGPGFSLGYARANFFTENLTAHIRTDLWFMDIDWEQKGLIICDPTACPNAVTRGTTEITVLQPTLGLGYNLILSENLFLKPNLSFGYEINIKTKGREVGEGAILLGGLSFGYDF